MFGFRFSSSSCSVYSVVRSSLLSVQSLLGDPTRRQVNGKPGTRGGDEQRVKPSLLIPYPRIEKSVRDVDDQIKDHDQDRQKRDDAEHKRLVTIENRLDKNI